MKVYAKSENIKKFPRFRWHPRGTTFSSEGMADWPDDAFTQRRIRDGDVTAEEPKAIAPKSKA